MQTFNILDLCCKAGGASMGYFNACKKFNIPVSIIGVDIEFQPNYPFKFIQSDAIEFLKQTNLKFDFIHSSPPCQVYSNSTAFHRKNGKTYKDILHELRTILYSNNIPGLIENVLQSPLRKDIILRGDLFGLKLLKTRVFELVNWFALYPGLFKKTGSVKNGDFAQVVGKGQKKVTNGLNFKISGNSVNEIWSNATGINWMSNIELAESIPPAYTDYIFSIFINQYLNKK